MTRRGADARHALPSGPLLPLAALLVTLAPLAEASLTRASIPGLVPQTAYALTLEPSPAPSEFSLFEGTELTTAAAESERAPSFHPLAAVSLLSKDGAEAPLVSADELSYPKTRYRVFGLLGTPILGIERGVSLELQWGCASFSCGIASGTVGWLSEDPLDDLDSPNLYGFVSMRPHEKTDPLGLAERTPEMKEQQCRVTGIGCPGYGGTVSLEAVAKEAAATAVEELSFVGVANGLSGSLLGYDFVRAEKVDGWSARVLAGVSAVPGIPSTVRKINALPVVKKKALQNSMEVAEALEEAPQALKSTARGNQMPFSAKAEEIVSEATGVERNLPGPGQQTIPGSGPRGIRAPDLLVRGVRGSFRLRGSIVEVKASAAGTNFGDLPSRGRQQLRDAVSYARRLRDRANLVKDPVVRETLENAHVEVFSDLKAPTSGEFADLIEEGLLRWKGIPR